jgi:hypothetical protein
VFGELEGERASKRTNDTAPETRLNNARQVWRVALASIMACSAATCAHIQRTSGDYVFGVVGIIRNQAGSPVAGAMIELELAGVAFQGTESVRRHTCMTDEGGGFTFMYIVHRRGMPYQLSISKAGYRHQVVHGAAPPSQSHSLVLEDGPEP